MIDADTLSRLWQQHVDRLLMVARAVGEPADDAVQEAFVQLAQQPVLPDDPLAWLVRVTRNQLLQWRRSGVRRLSREQSVAGQTPWLSSGDEGADGRLDCAEVTARLRELPDDVREVIVMHLWGGLTFQQISLVVHRSRSSVHRTYQHGIQELRCYFESFAEDRLR